MSYCWSDIRPVIPWFITSLSLAYVLYLRCHIRCQSKRWPKAPFNQSIDKSKHKVKHVLKGEDLEKGKKLSLCRCWRSETFPLCDGAHKQYNKDCKDNIGPVCIEWSDDFDDDLDHKTLIEPDVQSMNASTELSSLEMIDSNGDNTSAGSHSTDDNNQF